MSVLLDQLRAGLPDDDTAYQIIDEVAALQDGLAEGNEEIAYFQPALEDATKMLCEALDREAKQAGNGCLTLIY